MDKFCSLKKYYKEPDKPYNLISTCFFLADNYYKDPIQKYFNGLKITIEKYANIVPVTVINGAKLSL